MFVGLDVCMEFIVKNNIIKYDKVNDILSISKKCNNNKKITLVGGVVRYECENHTACAIRLHAVSKLTERKFGAHIRTHRMYFYNLSAKDIKEQIKLWK